MKKIRNLRQAGFTLVEIMIVVAIIGLLAAIAIPNFIKARATSQANACINNMRQLDGGEQQWALENHKTSTDAPLDVSTLVSSGYVRTPGGSTPTCPGNGAAYVVSATLSSSPVVTCALSTTVTPGHVLQ